MLSTSCLWPAHPWTARIHYRKKLKIVSMCLLSHLYLCAFAILVLLPGIFFLNFFHIPNLLLNVWFKCHLIHKGFWFPKLREIIAHLKPPFNLHITYVSSGSVSYYLFSSWCLGHVIYLCCGGCSVHCEMFSSIVGLYPLDACRICTLTTSPPSWQSKLSPDVT